ncbi:MAG: hypothetical protein HYV14_06180 [Elusimicrobia bacterium]|nr:hypothetical protein [Elusimicrobiota bacterium]
MKPPLLLLAFLSLAAAAGAADAPPAKKKSWAKPSGSSPSAQPGARVERRKPGFAPGGEGLSQTGGGAISSGGESVAGAGVSRGAADKRAKPNPGAGSSSGGGGAAGGASASASKSFEKAKMSVSVSSNGPWVQNGEACNTGKVYSRTTGVDRAKPPKGCASPFDSKDCLDVAKHREFLPNEWVDPFTIQTVVNGPDYPAGKYAMYLSDSKKSVKQVGFATLKACAPPAPACRWTSPDAVIGPCNGPGCSNPPCSTANKGAQGMGGGGMWTCTCD